MGRKIPAKKHRGVKDPLVQQARREKSLKSKINAPPKDPDEQPVPKSLTRLFAFQNKDKLVENPKKKKMKRLQDNKSGVGDNPISRLRKLPGESGRGFSLRINSAIKALHGEVTEDDYYPQDLEESDVKGDRMADFKQYRAKKARRAAGGRQPAPAPAARLTRTQKEALKKKAKQEKAQQVLKERQEVVYERVPFGEISHAPPSLTFKNKKVQPTGGAPRPGRRDLLLTKLLNNNSSSNNSSSNNSNSNSKPVSAADAMRKERARLDAVQAYRDLKANKFKNTNTVLI